MWVTEGRTISMGPRSAVTYAASLAEGLPRVRETIARAAERSGRGADSVRLLAVTKAHPLEAALAALDAGIRDLGENRVEELAWKAASLTDRDVRWHMIGHVQRRKVPKLAGIPELVHSVDSARLARRFSTVGVEADFRFSVLVQVNTSGEETKGGFELAAVVEAVHEIAELPALEVRGLMTMAPFVDDEEILRAAFGRLREAHEALKETEAYEGNELSMGMTNDYAIAIEEGSTMVRIGTALFGARQP